MTEETERLISFIAMAYTRRRIEKKWLVFPFAFNEGAFQEDVLKMARELAAKYEYSYPEGALDKKVGLLKLVYELRGDREDDDLRGMYFDKRVLELIEEIVGTYEASENVDSNEGSCGGS